MLHNVVQSWRACKLNIEKLRRKEVHPRSVHATLYDEATLPGTLAETSTASWLYQVFKRNTLWRIHHMVWHNQFCLAI
eukprot:5020374-Amphidinium_carterae.1